MSALGLAEAKSTGATADDGDSLVVEKDPSGRYSRVSYGGKHCSLCSCVLFRRLTGVAGRLNYVV